MPHEFKRNFIPSPILTPMIFAKTSLQTRKMALKLVLVSWAYGSYLKSPKFELKKDPILSLDTFWHHLSTKTYFNTWYNIISISLILKQTWAQRQASKLFDLILMISIGLTLSTFCLFVFSFIVLLLFLCAEHLSTYYTRFVCLW